MFLNRHGRLIADLFTVMFTMLWLLISAGSVAAQATTSHSGQSDKAPLWYQIEVIIFENRSANTYTPDPEVWPRNILIAYPTHSRYLLTPEELKALEAQEALAKEEAIRAGANPDTLSLTQEKPFIDLGESVYQLTRQKRAIDAERDMRVLYHKVWRQPVGERENAPSIIVSGGNKYDSHYELEGSLTVSVSRYLHLDTDLWFTSFEANIGQEENWWPILPTPPVRLSSEADLNALYEAGINKSQSQQLKTTSPPWMSDSATNSSIHFGLGSQFDDQQFDDKTNADAHNYVVKEIIKLEQSRRMRSGELHYVDHPKLGLIIRIDNYKTAQNEEAQNSQTQNP